MRLLTYTNPNGGSVTLGIGTEFHIETLDGIDGPDSDDQTQKAPAQDGTTWIDTLLQPRTVTITGKLRPQALASIFIDRTTLLAALNPKLGPGTLRLDNDAGSKIITALPKSPKFANKHAKNPFQSFLATFTAFDPYWYDVSPTVLTFRLAVPLFLLGAAGTWFWPSGGTPFAIMAGSRTQVVTNLGHALAPLQFVFSGPATNPKVTNLTTGQYVKVNVTLGVGDYLTVTTAQGKKTVVLTRLNASPVNAMGLWANGSSFFALALGPNSIQFTDDTLNTSSSLSLSFSNRFLGV